MVTLSAQPISESIAPLICLLKMAVKGDNYGTEPPPPIQSLFIYLQRMRRTNEDMGGLWILFGSHIRDMSLCTVYCMISNANLAAFKSC